MKSRLLIDSTVLAFVGGLKKRERDFLMARFEEIRGFPTDHADYQTLDERGRTLRRYLLGRLR